jgi:hypothetical protein
MEARLVVALDGYEREAQQHQADERRVAPDATDRALSPRHNKKARPGTPPQHVFLLVVRPGSVELGG